MWWEGLFLFDFVFLFFNLKKDNNCNNRFNFILLWNIGDLIWILVKIFFGEIEFYLFCKIEVIFLIWLSVILMFGMIRIIVFFCIIIEISGFGYL